MNCFYKSQYNTTSQQRWIKKKHYKTQHHARAKQRYFDFPANAKSKTPWQIFLKEFGDTEGSLVCK